MDQLTSPSNNSPHCDRYRVFGSSDLPIHERNLTLGEHPIISVEAASTFGWERYADVAIGIDRFGASAPGPVVMESLGMTVERVVIEAQRLTDKA